LFFFQVFVLLTLDRFDQLLRLPQLQPLSLFCSTMYTLLVMAVPVEMRVAARTEQSVFCVEYWMSFLQICHMANQEYL
jgi:hypothetical protein